MKKKLLAVLLCTTMSFALLTGCGAKAEEPAAAEETAEEEEAEEEEEEVEEEEADEETTEGCSDDTFAALQDTFASLSELYNLVNDYYMENDSIPQDDDVEEALNSAKEYLDEVGEINQDEITDADAVELAKSMVEVSEALQQMAESLDLVAASNTGCSDESFAALQEAYSYLVEEYNLVNDYYMNTDSIPQDDEVESILADAKDYLDQMGAIEQNTISEKDAADLAQSMSDVATALQTLADSL